MKKNSMMLLLVSVFLMFSACSNDDDEQATYTFTHTLDDVEGITLKVTLFEYNEKDELVAQNYVNDCRNGHTQNFAANKASQKVKVHFLASTRSQSVGFWMQQVYYLEEGKKIQITVTDESKMDTKYPQ